MKIKIELPTHINSSDKFKQYHQLAIDILSVCDGETVQYIVEQASQDEQLLGQLMNKSITDET